MNKKLFLVAIPVFLVGVGVGILVPNPSQQAKNENTSEVEAKEDKEIEQLEQTLPIITPHVGDAYRPEIIESYTEGYAKTYLLKFSDPIPNTKLKMSGIGLDTYGYTNIRNIDTEEVKMYLVGDEVLEGTEAIGKILDIESSNQYSALIVTLGVY
jgi:hypothetical protein